MKEWGGGDITPTTAQTKIIWEDKGRRKCEKGKWKMEGR